MKSMRGTVEVPVDVLRETREKALAALSDDKWNKIAKYFRIRSNFAGALFLGLEPNEPERFTAVDLFAASTLNVTVPARAARRFLVESAEQEKFSAGFKSLPDVSIENAEDADLHDMYAFYKVVKKTLKRHDSKSSNAWVTASKLVARKRPSLFPVRDRKVNGYLSLGKMETVVQEYAVYRHLMSDPDVSGRLLALEKLLVSRKESDGLVLEDSRLRLLDVALWRAAS